MFALELSHHLKSTKLSIFKEGILGSFFLPTSPELHLKKCLGLGFERIFEITRSYRNSEITDRHQPEFWILEWYRAFREPKSIERDLEDLIFDLADALPGVRRPKRVVRKSVAQLFLETFSFELMRPGRGGHLLLSKSMRLFQNRTVSQKNYALKRGQIE